MPEITTRPEQIHRLTGNFILDALEEDERLELLGEAKIKRLGIRTVLFEVHQPVFDVHFPLSGMVSLVTALKDKSVIEVATVGREGVVGIPMALTEKPLTVPVRGVSQVEGQVVTVPGAHFREQYRHNDHLSYLVNAYTQALFTLVGQNAACNRLHAMQERCARWLLMTHDRVGYDNFRLTHEFLAQMLGARRASVTAAAKWLKLTGTITYERGDVVILDRKGLEKFACECYEVAQEIFHEYSGITYQEVPKKTSVSTREP